MSSSPSSSPVVGIEAIAPSSSQSINGALNPRDVNNHDDRRDDKDEAQLSKKRQYNESNNDDDENNHNTNTYPEDDRLPSNVQKDPRGNGSILSRMTKKAAERGVGRNTESFDPRSTLVRPDVRVQIGNPTRAKYSNVLKHDDVVVVPELFGNEDDWTLYYKLIDELTEIQNNNERRPSGSSSSGEFIPWHEGSHLICKEPKESKTFQMIVQRLCEYFNIDPTTAGTRFNWYKDSQDWKVRYRNEEYRALIGIFF
jgi:hypothetical protein